MYTGILSGGQKSRLVLAQLTITRPHILLLDEPTNNLDTDGIKAFAAAINAWEGATIIASHDLTFVQETCLEFYQINTKDKSLVSLDGGVRAYVDAIREKVRLKKESIKWIEKYIAKTQNSLFVVEIDTAGKTKYPYIAGSELFAIENICHFASKESK